MKTELKIVCGAFVALGLLMAGGCEDKKAESTKTPVTGKTAGHDHDEDHDHDHDHSHAGHDHGGEKLDKLGTATVGDFLVIAMRGKGEVKAGGEVPVTVSVASAPDKKAKAAAVRFWVGTHDAKGSEKAKGEVEDPKKPDVWHEHVTAPNPIPAGSKLWVEIEDDKGAKVVGSFDLTADAGATTKPAEPAPLKN